MAATDRSASRVVAIVLVGALGIAVAVLSVSAFAFLLGALVTWMASLGARRRARRLAQTVRQLESELAQLRAQVVRQVPEGGEAMGRRPAKVALPAP